MCLALGWTKRACLILNCVYLSMPCCWDTPSSIKCAADILISLLAEDLIAHYTQMSSEAAQEQSPKGTVFFDDQLAEIEAEEDSESTAVSSREPKKRSKDVEKTFSLAIYKVLRQIWPDLYISHRAMSVLNGLIIELFERIATEASKLAALGKTSALTHRDLQTAVQIVIPHTFGRHANSEGTRFLTIYRYYKEYHEGII